MLSKDCLMLRSARRACPRHELGARLEARAASLQLIFWSVNQYTDSLFGRRPNHDHAARQQSDSNEPLFRMGKPLVGDCISQSGEYPFGVPKIDAALAKRLRPLRRIEGDPHRPSCSYRNHLHQVTLHTLRSLRRQLLANALALAPPNGAHLVIRQRVDNRLRDALLRIVKHRVCAGVGRPNFSRINPSESHRLCRITARSVDRFDDTFRLLSRLRDNEVKSMIISGFAGEFDTRRITDVV